MGVKYIEDINDGAMDKWISDLRSGEYSQTEGLLFRSSTGGMCCLGVLTAGQGLSVDQENSGFTGTDGVIFHHLPPQEVVKALNLPKKYTNIEESSMCVRVDAVSSERTYADENGTVSVTSLNDFLAMGFNDIADRLEASFLRDEYKKV